MVPCAEIDTSNAPTLKEALESRGISVNGALWDFYTKGAGKDYVRTPGKAANQENQSGRAGWHINEVPVSAYTSDVTSSFAQYNDAAIVTISRISGRRCRSGIRELQRRGKMCCLLLKKSRIC